ncbi:hypothetical protein P8452_72217 [Trifolium repens]|nr:hypothetical protein P8452_72217 [Trifolium repens]
MFSFPSQARHARVETEKTGRFNFLYTQRERTIDHHHRTVDLCPTTTTTAPHDRPLFSLYSQPRSRDLFQQ